MHPAANFLRLVLVLGASAFACDIPSVEPIADDPRPLRERITEMYERARESGEDVGSDAYDWAREDVKGIGDWQYRVVLHESGGDKALEERLNTLGEERWELVWIEPHGNALHLILKRPTRSYLRHLPLSELRHLAPSLTGDP